MNNRISFIPSIAVLVYCLSLTGTSAQIRSHGGGSLTNAECVSEEEYRWVKSQLLKTRPGDQSYKRGSVLLSDPMGGGGTNSFGKPVTMYMDLDTSGSLLDYNCGVVTYNGHHGTDISIRNFYDMDEGVPVLCAAPGVVIYTHDGEFDRQLQQQSGVLTNGVVVSHGDSLETSYYHMRKNSVRVELGDTVDVGDTLGYVGSSGSSSWPHIHFEVRRNDVVIDPFHGDCQPESSWWVEQGEYVLNLPTELHDHGLTTIEMTRELFAERPPTKNHVQVPGPIYSWITLRNIKEDDLLTWKFYANGSLWRLFGFSVEQTYTNSWWWIRWDLPSSSTYYGDWTLEIYRNDSLIAEQDFTYDDESNQVPVMDDLTLTVLPGSSIEGEFVADDPDGSIFWYEVVTLPKRGSFAQYGGRKRKFSYTPDAGFTGKDTVVFFALDDENAPGQSGMYVFNVTSVGVEESFTQVPLEFGLSQNYPNPFNPETVIEYALPEASNVSLVIYNLRGEEVVQLVNGKQPAGNHQVTWDASNDASGIYFYRLKSSDFFETKKMILLK